MAFDNKDLLTKLLPRISEHLERGCWLHSLICQWPTYHCHGTQCNNFTFTGCGLTGKCRAISVTTGCRIFSYCDNYSVTCIASRHFVIEYQEDLIAVRKELVDTLKKLEQLQRDGLPSIITTRAEADELQETLEQQLKHVRQVRDGLE